MKVSLRELASHLGAKVSAHDALDLVIDDLAGLETAGPSSLSFLANPKYEAFLYHTQAAAVLVSESFAPKETVQAVLLRVPDPYLSFTTVLEQAALRRAETGTGVHPTAVIEAGAKIGESVYIGPFAHIGKDVTISDHCRIYPFVSVGAGATVGEKSILYPHVSVYAGCNIGKGCIIHAGTVLGSDGFGFAPQDDGTYRKIPQLGNVKLGDGVEIGSNSCIDRATVGSTMIHAGVKLDNLVQVAHNVEIGEHSVIAAQAGIAGSSKLGKGVMVGGQAGFVGHIQIADGTKVDAQSGVNKSISKPGQAFRGSPIQAHRQQLKSELMFRKLVEMEERIRALEAAQKGAVK